MKPHLIIAGLMALVIYSSGFSQKKFLTGTVRMSGQPVKGLTLITYFHTTTTDDYGRYALSFDGCPNCLPGNKISISTNHEELGASEQICTISNDYVFDFSIIRNPSWKLITGTVRNTTQNKDPLPGIDVFVMGLDYELSPVKTNNFGEFKIYIPKSILPDKNAVLLQASDSTRKYKPKHADPEYFNINAYAIIQMEPSEAHRIVVRGFTRTTVCVKKGDAISIEADGSIKVGSFVGSSDPDGRSSGVLGLSLESYNIVSRFNHAVLMYRFTGEDEWKVAGKRKRFIAPRDGCIEFEVNDNSQGDNSGYYEVEVSIQSI